MVSSINSVSLVDPILLTQGHSSSKKSANLAKLIIATYMHEIVMNSWDKFRETQKDHAQRNSEKHRANEGNSQRLRASLRYLAETLVRRQAAHIGIFTGVSLEAGRHLQVPV